MANFIKKRSLKLDIRSGNLQMRNWKLEQATRVIQNNYFYYFAGSA